MWSSKPNPWSAQAIIEREKRQTTPARHTAPARRAARRPATTRERLLDVLRIAVFGWGTLFLGGRHALR